MLLMGALIFSGCITKSAYEVSNRESLSTYDYILLRPLSQDAADKNFEEELIRVYEDAGLTVLDQNGLDTLPEAENQKVLLAEYDREDGSLECIMTIFYSDSQTHEETAFCRGTWGLRKKETNEELARKNAVNQTRYMFGLGDEIGEYNKYSWY